MARNIAINYVSTAEVLDCESDRCGEDDPAEDAYDKEESSHHPGYCLVTWNHVAWSIHHGKTAEISASESHEDGSSTVYVVTEQDGQRACRRMDVTQHEERYEESAQQHWDPDPPRTWLLNERREDVSGDGKRVEKQETRHRFEIFR